MPETTVDLINQLNLWLEQDVPLVWLLSMIGVVFFIILLIWFTSAKRHRADRENEYELKLERASTSEKIQSLDKENQVLLEKERQHTQQIQELIAQSSKLQSSRDEKVQQLIENEKERFGLREMHENDQRKISRMEADIREQQAQLNAEKEKLFELKAQFEKQKSELENQFKVVSEKVIKDRQVMLNEQNKEGVGALLKPLQDQINGFQKRINEVHDVSVKGNASLKAEIENVMKMGIKMSGEAQNLTSALKGDSQQSGAWGEAQLERTLEMSGLIENDHFEKQSSFVDEQGSRKRTDYLIKLPGDKCIVIDSKVSLNDYERAISAEPELLNGLMQKHCDAVRKHIKDLESKDYTNLNAIHSPDFVLMFMPIEPAYIEAMKHDKALFSFGYERNVILVSHTTLIPILRTVSNLWMLDRSNKEARLIGEKASDIYKSVATVSERLESLGNTLKTASKHYNNTVTAIAGNQGLQGKVERFNLLSNKANKSMPKLEPSYVELDTQKLQIEKLESDQEE